MGESSHFDETGGSRKVDVGDRPATRQAARAAGQGESTANLTPTDEELAILHKGMVKWEAERKRRDAQYARRFPVAIASTRRFGLSTFLFASLAFAFLAAAMRWAEMPAGVSLFVVGLIPLVGMAQGLLFQGRRPRTAAALVGILYTTAVGMIAWELPWPLLRMQWARFGFFFVLGGASFGVTAGALIDLTFATLSLFRRERTPALKSQVELQHMSEPVGRRAASFEK